MTYFQKVATMALKHTHQIFLTEGQVRTAIMNYVAENSSGKFSPQGRLHAEVKAYNGAHPAAFTTVVCTWTEDEEGK